MHVLVVAQQRQESESLRQVLCGLGHTVAVAKSTPDIVGTMTRGPRPQICVMIDPAADGLRPLREADGPHIYVIGALHGTGGRAVKEAWDAGVDDIMSVKASPEELAGRVDAVERIRRWVGTMGDGFVASSSDPTSRLACLRKLGELLSEEFSQMTGAELVCERLSDCSTQYAAEIPLTLVSEGVELTLGIGLRPQAVGTFSELLFGEAVGHDILADAIREFANTAGGALKRHANDEGATFSLGLPEDNVAPSIPKDATLWRLHADGLEICVWLVARDDTPKRLSTSMLREGMVISQPVKNAAGVLLVPAGSVLTARTVRRLLDMLGPATLVEVSHAA